MKVLIAGNKGRLGMALSSTLPGSFDMCGVDLPEIDITVWQSTQTVCSAFSPNAEKKQIYMRNQESKRRFERQVGVGS